MNIKILLTPDKSFSINNDNALRTLHQHFSHNWKRTETETHDIKCVGIRCVRQVLLHLVPASPRMCWGEVEVNIVAVKSTARLGWGGLSGTGGGWDGGRPSPAWHWPGCCHLLQSPLMVSAGCDQSPDCSLLGPSATPHTSAADIPATSNTTPLRSAETLQ